MRAHHDAERTGISRRSALTLGSDRARVHQLRFTQYFSFVRQRPDRAVIQDEWIQRVIDAPVREEVQRDARIRRWAPIEEMDNRYLRVVLLPDGETVHNAFFDRGLKP